MRLLNYLNEQEEDNVVDLVRRDCKPFFKEAKGSDGFLIRQTKMIQGKYEVKKTRINREPTDTPEFIHKKLDDYLKDKFGWRARSNALFCWSSAVLTSPSIKKMPQSFGLVFPIGKFEFVWSSEIRDVYLEMEKFAKKYTDQSPMTELQDLDETQLEEVWEEFRKSGLLESYTNKNLQRALKSRSEIMIRTGEYYFINPKELTDREMDELYSTIFYNRGIR